MADYQLTTSDETGEVMRTVDGAHIPPDPANRDWQDYQQWFAEGGVPDPFVVPKQIDPALDGFGFGKTAAQILGA